MVSKLLKKALPAPLRPPIRAAVLLLIPPLRRRLRHTWRSGVKRRVRRRRNRLRLLWSKLQRFLRNVWRRQLKQRLWLAIWRIDTWRRGTRPLESNNQIHLISSQWERIELGNAQRTLHLFDELKDHADVHLWTERPSVPPELREGAERWRSCMPPNLPRGGLVIVQVLFRPPSSTSIGSSLRRARSPLLNL